MKKVLIALALVAAPVLTACEDESVNTVNTTQTVTDNGQTVTVDNQTVVTNEQ